MRATQEQHQLAAAGWPIVRFRVANVQLAYVPDERGARKPALMQAKVSYSGECSGEVRSSADASAAASACTALASAGELLRALRCSCKLLLAGAV